MTEKKLEVLEKIVEQNVDIASRTIYLTGDIDEDVASNFIKKLSYLDKTAGEITIILNSEGGEVYSGFAMYDAIRMCQERVVIRVLGVAMSIASVILQAADHRVFTKNSSMMIHRGSLETEGNMRESKAWVKEVDRLDAVCIDIYYDKIKEKKNRFARKKLEEMMDCDTYLSSSQVLDLGLCDEVLD